MKLKKLLSLLLCLVMIFSCVLPLASCKNKNKNKDEGNTGGTVIDGGSSGGSTEYTVKVITEGGMPLEDVVVSIHTGDGFKITQMGATDKNGNVKFTVTPKGGALGTPRPASFFFRVKMK